MNIGAKLLTGFGAVLAAMLVMGIVSISKTDRCQLAPRFSW